jgi:hypothetical protein
MCDYSLHHVATTPAKVGDKLTSTLFRASVTRGFCGVGAPEVAVCLLPGAELAFESDVKIDRVLAFLPKKIIKARVARFRQVNMDKPYEHHDALEFPDGRIVLVTQLTPGQKATVLQLPVVAKPETRRAEPAPAVMPIAAPVPAPGARHGAF